MSGIGLLLYSKVGISLKWEEMPTEIDNFEYEFNGILIVLKIYCEDKAK